MMRRAPYAPLLSANFHHVSPAFAYRFQGEGETEAHVQVAIMNGQRVPARQRHPGMDPSLDAAIERATRKEPGERFRSCAEFARALEAEGPRPHVAPAPQAAPTASPESPKRSTSERRWGVWGAGIVVVGVVLWGLSEVAGAPECPPDMVKIPAGTFTMGSENDPEASGDEKPSHKVTVSAFCLAKTEVTQADWSRVMGGNPSNFKGDKRPVETLSWNDAVAYCNKRSQREGLRAAYDANGKLVPGANGYRLPTEAEWEYAARAGTKTPRYGELDAIAWYDRNSGSETHDVGTKKANAWGLYDMLGNVWEWTHDWYESYGGGAQRDPRGPSSGSDRVTRGGSWFSSASAVRASQRFGIAPGYTNSYIGFRPLRSLP
jgi:formylglycine-generating enzyme required for sulfatase activity